jgi:predicted HAD superfamily Cof-like phosphohydrolase
VGYALATTALKYQRNHSWYIGAVEELSADARVELLDALCDQVVTAIGVAYMMGMDIEGALAEVNRSNWSKFKGGFVPVFNEHGKIAKCAEYTPPELSDYI